MSLLQSRIETAVSLSTAKELELFSTFSLLEKKKNNNVKGES